MPTVYYLVNKNSDLKKAKRADHLARVTAGMNKKQWAEYKAKEAAKKAAERGQKTEINEGA
jgi:hypothetical protein